MNSTLFNPSVVAIANPHTLREPKSSTPLFVKHSVRLAVWCALLAIAVITLTVIAAPHLPQGGLDASSWSLMARAAIVAVLLMGTLVPLAISAMSALEAVMATKSIRNQRGTLRN